MALIPDKKKYLLYILRALMSLVLATLLIINFFIFYFSYDQLVNAILNSFNMQDKILQFKASFFTPVKFLLLKSFILLFTLIIFIIVRKAKEEKILLYAKNIYKGIGETLLKVKKLFMELPLLQKIVLALVFTVIIACRIFYFYKFPLFTDEAFSYVYFVSRGFLVSATYYPGPNNHVFYSELCTLTNLFFDDPLLVMRLPSFFVSIVLSFLLFISVKKYYGFLTALFTLVLFSLSENINFYSIQGRGYILLILLILLSGLTLVKYLFDRKEIYLFLFIIFSALGFYTIPIFLYPFLSFAAFTLLFLIKQKQLQYMPQFVFIFLGIGLLVILLYLPVLLFNSMNTITGSPWVLPSENFSSELVPYVLKVNDYLWNIKNGFAVTIGVMTGSLFFLFLNKKSKEIIFGLIWFAVPLLFISIQKVIPFERVWLYMYILLSFGFSYFLIQLISAFIANQYIKNIFTSMLICSFLCLMLISNVKTVLDKSFEYYIQMTSFINQVYKADPSDILAEDSDCNTFIKYKYLQEGKPVDVKSGKQAFDQYEMIVTSVASANEIDTSLYNVAFSNSYVKAYLLKK
jgi:hypothetical protein